MRVRECCSWMLWGRGSYREREKERGRPLLQLSPRHENPAHICGTEKTMAFMKRRPYRKVWRWLWLGLCYSRLWKGGVSWPGYGAAEEGGFPGPALPCLCVCLHSQPLWRSRRRRGLSGLVWLSGSVPLHLAPLLVVNENEEEEVNGSSKPPIQQCYHSRDRFTTFEILVMGKLYLLSRPFQNSSLVTLEVQRVWQG